MKELLEKLFLGHSHKWEIIVHGVLVNDMHQKCGNYYDVKCVHCGKIKRTTCTN